MPLTFNKFLVSSTDGSSPATGTPAVQCCTPGGSWFTPSTPPVGLGDGWWRIALTDGELAGGYPLLTYLVAPDSWPAPDIRTAATGSTWTAGATAPALPFWLGTTASNAWLPAAGLTPTVMVQPPGGSFAPAGGAVSEPGGAGAGLGFYRYTPTAAETTPAGDLLLLASATSAVDWSADYTIGPAAASVSWPTVLPSNRTLDLNQAPRTSVFRQVVSFVRNDATIKRLLKPSSIRAWDGLPQDSADFAVGIAPAIRFTPVTGPDAFWSPGSMRGDLFIDVEMLVAGTCVDDVLNLWWAIVRAIYPAAQSSTNANVLALQRAGSYDGLVTFSSPAFDPEPKDNYFAATGQIRVSVNNQLLAG